MQNQTAQEFIVTWRLKYADASCVGGHNTCLFYIPTKAADRTKAVEPTRDKAVQTASTWCLEHGIGDRFFANAMMAIKVETPTEHQDSEKSEARNEKQAHSFLIWSALALGGLLAATIIISETLKLIDQIAGS